MAIEPYDEAYKDKIRLEKTNEDVELLEAQITKTFREMERRRILSYDKPEDYGEVSFNVTVVLDEFNAEDLVELATKASKLLIERRELRKLQHRLRLKDARRYAYRHDLMMSDPSLGVSAERGVDL